MLKNHLKIAFRNFTYDFIYGDTKTALGMPNSIVLSEPLAHNFFGKDNPVEKSIVVNSPFGEFNYTVKGVFRTGYC